MTDLGSPAGELAQRIAELSAEELFTIARGAQQSGYPMMQWPSALREALAEVLAGPVERVALAAAIVGDVLYAAAKFPDKPHQLYSALARFAKGHGDADAEREMLAAYEKVGAASGAALQRAEVAASLNLQARMAMKDDLLTRIVALERTLAKIASATKAPSTTGVEFAARLQGWARAALAERGDK